MKSLWKNRHGDVGAIGMAVAILVTIMVSVLIVYSIGVSLDTTDIDADIRTNLPDVTTNRAESADGLYRNTSYAYNASMDIFDQSATFYTIAPLIVVVLVAVIILGYVIQLGGRRM